MSGLSGLSTSSLTSQETKFTQATSSHQQPSAAIPTLEALKLTDIPLCTSIFQAHSLLPHGRFSPGSHTVTHWGGNVKRRPCA